MEGEPQREPGSSGLVEIRPGRPDDAEVIARFQILMAQETEGLELDPETVRRGVVAVFSDPTQGCYWMAESDGQILGCLLVTPEWSDWRNGTVLWIQSLYVLPEARGRGVCRSLYEHLRRQVEASPDLGYAVCQSRSPTAFSRVPGA